MIILQLDAEAPLRKEFDDEALELHGLLARRHEGQPITVRLTADILPLLRSCSSS